tara:strand:- start:2439 stop:3818 length:1380 start_codon:yes stop_codon:yes gene_type:complete
MVIVTNTLTKKREEIVGKKLNLFVCGPTVYDYIHIGNARSFSFFDTFAKYLRFAGYTVHYLQNITDIDDKIIRRAHTSKKTFESVAEKFTKEYKQDMKLLNVTAVDTYAPATKFIKEIIGQVKRLVDNGFAYEIEDGIYFDVTKFKRYGQLRKVDLEEDAVSRIDVSDSKRNSQDFCLWKKYKKGEPFWQGPFGKGRPGWHIEDTAISEKFFGSQYDIHGGGIDLIFPHHEAEITQMEAISGKFPFVKYWVHNGWVLVDGEKMAKSKGNFITSREAVSKWGAEPVRLFFNHTHYSSPINFTSDALDSAKKSLSVLVNSWSKVISEIKKSKKGTKNKNVMGKLAKWEGSFRKAMDNDFNTSVGLSVLFEMSTYMNKLEGESKDTWKAIEEKYVELGNILGVFYEKPIKVKIPAEVKKLAEERLSARNKKDWKKSDSLRNEINKLGFVIEDVKNGYELMKK